MAERQKCKYSLSDFYIYMDEVPKNERVSTPEDCEKCDEGCINEKHCIIVENPNEEDVKLKRCENRCPCCGNDDIDWGASFSVDDGLYHQRGSCSKCNFCFTEVSEMKYVGTVLGDIE
jgi:hypothetical protein